MFTPHSG